MYLQSIWIFWKSRLTGGLRQCGIYPLTCKKMRPLHTAWQCIKSALQLSISFLYWNDSSVYVPTCPEGGCGLFLTVYYQDILGLSDRLIIAAGNQQRSAGKAPAHKNTPNPNSESGGMKNQPLQNLVFFIGGAICLVHIFENHQTTYNWIAMPL